MEGAVSRAAAAGKGDRPGNDGRPMHFSGRRGRRQRVRTSRPAMSKGNENARGRVAHRGLTRAAGAARGRRYCVSRGRDSRVRSTAKGAAA